MNVNQARQRSFLTLAKTAGTLITYQSVINFQSNFQPHSCRSTALTCRPKSPAPSASGARTRAPVSCWMRRWICSLKKALLPRAPKKWRCARASPKARSSCISPARKSCSKPWCATTSPRITQSGTSRSAAFKVPPPRCCTAVCKVGGRPWARPKPRASLN